MRCSVLALLATAALAAAPADRTGSVRLLGYDFLALGCPVAEHTLLTARHVVLGEEEGRRVSRAAVWEDGHGHTGTAWMEDFDLRRDLGVMSSDAPFVEVMTLAAAPPQRGEKVTYMLYDTKPPFGLRRVESQVLNVVASRLILAPRSRPGASGGCILNAAGEVVGVISAAIFIDADAYTIGMGVWPPWDDVSWTPPKKEPQP